MLLLYVFFIYPEQEEELRDMNIRGIKKLDNYVRQSREHELFMQRPENSNEDKEYINCQVIFRHTYDCDCVNTSL